MSNNLRISNEGQSAARTGHVLHIFAQGVCHESQNGKYHKASKETGQAVTDGDYESVPKNEKYNALLSDIFLEGIEIKWTKCEGANCSLRINNNEK